MMHKASNFAAPQEEKKYDANAKKLLEKHHDNDGHNHEHS
jgi:Cd2+/Zn2+-exporting ATPase